MKQLLLFLCWSFTLPVAAQKAYFQQQVDYTIDVTLNDTAHVLEGFVTMRYQNNSPDTLREIFFHLWPNAYRDQTSPFARQQLENGDTKFYYSKAVQRGFIDKLNFKVNAEEVRWNYDTTCIEFARVLLNSPLAPGTSITISTPFRVKIPETFSRLGHAGQSYQITQWYPKPAVYDVDGWHTMPYLDQGEFYSEFGSYDVHITLPANYRVAATGDLQNESEAQWLDSLHNLTKNITAFGDDMRFPASSTNKKTLHYKQEKVHDFAWFADKRFHVLKGEVELPYSKKKVITWAFFTNQQGSLWAKAPDYLHDAIYYYSLWLGDYPYRHVTAVDGALSAGGGMEYPNVTVISEVQSAFMLDNVITHEVGHNWFYGILGSNEREHPWLDEGLNSYYENRYIETKYPQQRLVGRLPKFIARFLDVYQYKNKYLADLGYQLMARQNLDQPVTTAAEQVTPFNYGTITYGKSALAFDYLEEYLGAVLFDSCMKQYYETWKFKHPQPNDLRQIFERVTQKKLAWFFDDLLNSTKKIDYALHRLKKQNDSLQITLSNRGEIAGPVSVSVLKKDSVLQTFWIEPLEQKKVISVPVIAAGDEVRIDPLLHIPEVNRKNNSYHLKRWPHRLEKIRLQFLSSIENQQRTQICFAPYLGWNNYDKVQVGLAFYNPIVPTQKFSYVLAPAIATGSLQFVGSGKMSYSFFPEGRVQRFTAGISGKRYSYLLFPQPLLFNKVEPFVEIEFRKKKPRSAFIQSLFIRSVYVWLDRIRFENKQKETQRYYVNELRYRLQRNTTLHPFSIQFTMQQGNQFMGLWGEGTFKISYKKRNEGFSIRVFAGGFPVYFKPDNDINAPLPRIFLSTVTNNTFAYWLQRDYMFDENFIDRNGRERVFARQVALTGGAFRSITTFGATNKFLTSANFSSTIHRFVPLVPFACMAMVLNNRNKAEFAAELGITLRLLPNIAEIHLPLITTKNIQQNQQATGITKWYQRITFTLKLPSQRPLELIRKLI